MRRIAVLAGALSAFVLGVPSSALAARDYADTARNIIPSGQLGALPVPADADRQAKMYDGLTPLFSHVTTSDLFSYFKSERLGTAGQGPLTSETVAGRPGVKLVRDGFHVPHITGKTRDDVTFATGWVVAEDRGLLLEQARGPSRLAAVDAPGLKAIDLIKSLRGFTTSPQTEAELAKQTAVLRGAGRKGRQLLHDIDVYVAGINAYYKAKSSTAKPWTRNDVYAVNALKGQFVGQGGGDEARRAQFLDGLQKRLGSKRGLSVFNDLREREDPETPVSLPGRFPYGSVPKRATGNVVIDAGSLDKSVAAISSVHASNILLVSGKRSKTGRPLFVGGPQIGYFYPGLTLEMDLKGPGIDVRGATSVPFPGYMLIGRGPDFAWTLTSQGGDIIDEYAETLCGGDDFHYIYKGKCRPMGRFNAGHLAAGGTPPEPARDVTFHTTVHGPVVGYAKSHGRRVAISSKRSSRGRETLDQLFFQDLTWGHIDTPRDFFKAASQTPQTFNAFYADNRHIAMYTTGRLPIRPSDVDPGLPIEGTGRHEWRGIVPSRRHPQGIDPKSGMIVNWNNKPARGWQASDSEWAYGSAQRVDLLNRNLASRKKHDLASLTGAMNAAATQDVRAIDTIPVLAAVLKRGTAPSPRAAQMLGLLEAWRRHGGSRLDRDGAGFIDDPGAAILDTAWNRLADAALKPVLGPQLDEFSKFVKRFDAPPEGQFNGWHIYMDKDLRTLLRQRVSGRFANRYCGAGVLSACSRDLWAALESAGNDLAAAQGPDPAKWRADASPERIKFLPGLLPYTMRYTNRPTGIQQVISFRGHRPIPRSKR